MDGSNYFYFKIPRAEYDRLLKVRHALQEDQQPSPSHEAGVLIGELGCQLMDQVFGQLMRHLQERRSHIYYQQSLATIHEIQGMLRKYSPWAAGLFGASRLLPVAEYYLQLMQPPASATSPAVLRVPVSDALYRQARDGLQQARSGQANLVALVEVLVDTNEACLDVLLYQPKALLRFNFVADKTLGGVIALGKTVGFRQLRKMSQVLQPDEVDFMATHLQGFMQPPAA